MLVQDYGDRQCEQMCVMRTVVQAEPETNNVSNARRRSPNPGMRLLR